MDIFLTILAVLLGSCLAAEESVHPVDLPDDCCLPGQTITSTDEFDINQALNMIFPTQWWAKNSAGIAVSNSGGGELSNPQKYELSGYVNDLMPKDIVSGETGLLLHLNTVYFYGPEGVVSYDIQNTDYKVVIAYSVPWNDILYDNMFNAKIYKKTLAVDSDLAQHMLSSGSAYWKPENGGGYMTRNEYGIELEVTMTNADESKVVIWVDSSGYNIYAGPELASGCSYNGLFNKVCWRECDANNVGWQWTTKSCWTNEDCENPNEYTPDSVCEVSTLTPLHH